MSTTTQDKFESRLELLAEENGLDFINDRTYANVGRYRFERAGVFDSVFGFGYSWQSGYASFTGDELPRRRSGNLWSYVQPDQLEEFLDAVESALSEAMA